MDEKKLIGRRIKELRKRKGFSQEQLAEKAETSPNYLSRMERGTENPTLDMLIKLSNTLEVEMCEMFDFGHVASQKELKQAIQDFSRTADEPALRLALKILRAVVR